MWVVFQPLKRRQRGHVGVHVAASLWVTGFIYPQLIYAENCQPVVMTYFPYYHTVSKA